MQGPKHKGNVNVGRDSRDDKGKPMNKFTSKVIGVVLRENRWEGEGTVGPEHGKMEGSA